MLPSLGDLLPQRLLVALLKFFDGFKLGGVLRDECPLLQQGQYVLGKIFVLVESGDVVE